MTRALDHLISGVHSEGNSLTQTYITWYDIAFGVEDGGIRYRHSGTYRSEQSLEVIW